MGMIAYVRQIYLDADHYKLVKDAYDENPRGMKRPEYDRALEGVIESKRILLPANRWVEIERMVQFAAELKQPAILYGLREGLRRAVGGSSERQEYAGAGEFEVAGAAAGRESGRWPNAAGAGDSREGADGSGGAAVRRASRSRFTPMASIRRATCSGR